MARLSAGALSRIRRSSGPRNRVLRASRAGDNAAAEQALQEARAELGMEELSLKARLLMISFHQAAEAYLDYCNGCFEEARAALLKALEATHTLQWFAAHLPTVYVASCQDNPHR